MKIYSLLIFILFTSNELKSEVWPIYTLSELIYRSNDIVEVEYQCKYDDNHLFTTSTNDSIWINRKNYLFYSSETDIVDPTKTNCIQKGIYESDKCIFFLENKPSKDATLIYSGIRIIRNKQIYSPIHFRTYELCCTDENLDIHELKKRINILNKSIDELKKIESKKNTQSFNPTQLSLWINNHDKLFKKLILGDVKTGALQRWAFVNELAIEEKYKLKHDTLINKKPMYNNK